MKCVKLEIYMNLHTGQVANDIPCQPSSCSVKPTAAEQAEYLAYHNEQDFFNNLITGIQDLSHLNIPYKKNCTLLCGGMAGFDKGLLHFINNYSNSLKHQKRSMILLSEVTAEYRRYTAEKVKMPFLCTPHLLAKEIIVSGLSISISDEMLKLINQKKYIQNAIQLLKARHIHIGEGYAEAWAFFSYQYISLLLQKIVPEKVILWNKYYAFHLIFDGICTEQRIPTQYMEFGCLPGTISIDKGGQMGESFAAKHYRKFRRLEINDNEFFEMQKILTYLKESGLNRNPQPNILFHKEYWHHKKGCPFIIYMGQNDYESGLYPYTKNTKKNHSPVFKSTLEALNYLILLSLKNSWNLLYKPHPIMESLGLADKNTADISEYMISNVNINSLIDCSDVIITIFSQSAYISLIREKPVVMLGYTQLRGKGCSYDAFCKLAIEQQIKKALKYKFTTSQKKNFIKHCAQLKKYYLLDDLQDKPYSIGTKLIQ